MTAARWTLAACIPMILACGGLGASVDVGNHLKRVCGERPSVRLPPDLDLPVRDAPPVALTDPLPLPILVRPDGIEVSERQTDDPFGAIRAEVERLGDGVKPALFAESGARITDVSQVIAVLYETGVKQILLVSATEDPWGVPDPPDPATAERIEALLADAPEDQRMSVAFAALADATALCPPATDSLSSMGTMGGDICTTLADELDRTLGPCLLTDVDEVVTIAQLAMAPPGPHKLTATPVAISDQAPPMEVDPDTVWGDHAERLRTPLWIEVVLPEEETTGSGEQG